MIKDIPKTVLKQIITLDDKREAAIGRNIVRYYSYFDYDDKRHFVEVKVAVKTNKKTNEKMIKQVLYTDLKGDSYGKDLIYYYTGGYVVLWEEDQEFDLWSKEFKVMGPGAIRVGDERLKRTKYRYSGVDRSRAEDGIKYIATWEKHPKVELLAKAGLSRYVDSARIVNKLEKDSEFVQFLRGNLDFLRNEYILPTEVLRAYKHGNSVEREHSLKDYKTIADTFTGKRLDKVLDYLQQNNIRYSHYDDYIKACLYLGVDLNNTKNCMPRDFSFWHNVRANEYAAKKENIHDNKIKSVADKFRSMEKTGEFIVLIASSSLELREEGNALSHCVGKMGYDKKIAEEKSLIFFVREKTAPTIPYVTVEYSISDKKILQAYGKNNSRPSIETMQFLEKKWLPHAKKALVGE